jgi:hypothetical protein
MKKFAILLLIALMSGLTPKCASSDRCEGPGEAINPSSDRPEGELPFWAMGSFGRYDGDVYNFLIQADGTAYKGQDGGDYGACTTLTAVFAGGRIHLVVDLEDLETTHTLIVRTIDGRFFEGPSDNEDLTCGWHELEPVNLCGTDVGGCGRYGDVEPCPWEDVGGRMGCVPDEEA